MSVFSFEIASEKYLYKIISTGEQPFETILVFLP